MASPLRCRPSPPALALALIAIAPLTCLNSFASRPPDICPPGWQLAGTRCLALTLSPTPWSLANDACLALPGGTGARAADVRSAEEDVMAGWVCAEEQAAEAVCMPSIDVLMEGENMCCCQQFDDVGSPELCYNATSSTCTQTLDRYPSSQPTLSPTISPTSMNPSKSPTKSPSVQRPSRSPSKSPNSQFPSTTPTNSPRSQQPTRSPTIKPSRAPSKSPTTVNPTPSPTKPSQLPSKSPSLSPSTEKPTFSPTSKRPSRSPTLSPLSKYPSKSPTTVKPTTSPTVTIPTLLPTKSPFSLLPSVSPSQSPTGRMPSVSPGISRPSVSPTAAPLSYMPSISPTASPTSKRPSKSPSRRPTSTPTTVKPSKSPSRSPSSSPRSSRPSRSPSKSPATKRPSKSPSFSPFTKSPSRSPSESPSRSPTKSPHRTPTSSPSRKPTHSPSRKPSKSPTTKRPSLSPSTSQPSASPYCPGTVINDICFSSGRRLLKNDQAKSFMRLELPQHDDSALLDDSWFTEIAKALRRYTQSQANGDPKSTSLVTKDRHLGSTPSSSPTQSPVQKCTRAPEISVCKPPPNYYSLGQGVGRGECWIGASRPLGKSINETVIFNMTLPVNVSNTLSAYQNWEHELAPLLYSAAPGTFLNPTSSGTVPSCAAIWFYNFSASWVLDNCTKQAPAVCIRDADCPDGYYRSTNFSVSDTGNVTQAVCSQCAINHYCLNNTMTPCQLGYYTNNQQGATFCTSPSPTSSPTSSRPSSSPHSSKPTRSPSRAPSTSAPSFSPISSRPSQSPSSSPTTTQPTLSPHSSHPSSAPTSARPSRAPSWSPTSLVPSQSPATMTPTKSPTSSQPTRSPTASPSVAAPSQSPTLSFVYEPQSLFDYSLALGTVSTQAIPLDINSNHLIISAAQCSGFPSAAWLLPPPAASATLGQQFLLNLQLDVSTALTGASSAVNSSYPAQSLEACLRITADNTLTGQSYVPAAVFVRVVCYVPCFAGTTSSSGTNLNESCTNCTLGTYQTAQGSTSCLNCTNLTPYTLTTGSTLTSECLPCPLGLYCPVGSTPLPCAPYGYESLANYLTLNGRDPALCENLACQPGWWCGAGAAEGSSYRKVLSYASVVSSTVVVKSTRVLSWTLDNFDGSTGVFVLPAQVPSFISVFSVDGNSTADPLAGEYVYIPPLTTVSFSLTVTSQYAAIDATELDGSILFLWTMANDSQLVQPFNFSVVFNMALTQPLVTPSKFVYVISNLSAALNPSPIVSVFNTLCNSSITYTIEQGCYNGTLTIEAPSWFVYDFPFDYKRQSKTIAAQQGLPDNLPFYFDFSNVALPNPLFPAAEYVNCFTVVVVMDSLGLTASFPVEVLATITEPCPAGMISQTGDNQQGCTPCAIGTWIDTTGQKACLACNSSLPTTRSKGSTSSENCTARAGSVLVNGTALGCPIGANCDNADGYGYTLQTLPLYPGYYRSSPDSQLIKPCPRTWYCTGGAFNQTSRRRLDFTGIDQQGPLCLAHHTGPYCYSCVSTFVKRGANHICSTCDPATYAADEQRIVGIFVGLFILLIALVVYVIWRFYKSFKANINNTKNTSFSLFGSWSSFIELGNKFKILVGLLQVVGGMYYSLGDDLPYFFQEVSQVLSFLTLDVTTIFDFGCTLSAQNHLTSLYVSTALPALLMGFIALVYLIAKQMLHRHRLFTLDENLKIFVSTLLLGVTFVIYPTLSATILRTFNCAALDDAAHFLVYDPSVDCDSAEYHSAYIYASFMIVFYVAGVPLTYSWLLWQNRAELNPSRQGFSPDMIFAVRDENRRILFLRFLWEPYKPKYFWFEVFELFRKLAQTSLVVFAANGTSMQIIVQLAISFIAITALSSLRPYHIRADNALATVAQWIIFGVSFISLLIKYDRELQAPSDVITQLQTIQIALIFFAPLLAILQVIAEYKDWIALRRFKRERGITAGQDLVTKEGKQIEAKADVEAATALPGLVQPAEPTARRELGSLPNRDNNDFAQRRPSFEKFGNAALERALEHPPVDATAHNKLLQARITELESVVTMAEKLADMQNTGRFEAERRLAQVEEALVDTEKVKKQAVLTNESLVREVAALKEENEKLLQQQQLKKRMSHGATAASGHEHNEQVHVEPNDNTNVATKVLLGLGFSTPEIGDALLRANGDVEIAANILLTGESHTQSSWRMLTRQPVDDFLHAENNLAPNVSPAATHSE